MLNPIGDYIKAIIAYSGASPSPYALERGKQLIAGVSLPRAEINGFADALHVVRLFLL